MTRKSILSFCLLLFSALALSAQDKKATNKIPAWSVDYNIFFQKDTASKSRHNQMAVLLAKALSGDEDGPMIFSYITYNGARIEQSGLMSYTTLVNKNDSVYYVLDTALREAYRKQSTIETRMIGDSLIVIDPKDFKVTFKDTTKNILGYSCKKAVFINSSVPDVPIIAWYTEKIPALYWGKYSYLKKLPGCALSIYAVKENMKIGIKANQIGKVKVSPEIFTVPSNYEIVNAY